MVNFSRKCIQAYRDGGKALSTVILLWLSLGQVDATLDLPYHLPCKFVGQEDEDDMYRCRMTCTPRAIEGDASRGPRTGMCPV